LEKEKKRRKRKRLTSITETPPTGLVAGFFNQNLVFSYNGIIPISPRRGGGGGEKRGKRVSQEAGITYGSILPIMFFL